MKTCDHCDREIIYTVPNKICIVNCVGLQCGHTEVYLLADEDCRQVILKKKENLTREVKSDLTSKGRKFNSKDYEKFNKGGSVNSKKSCGLAVRGHGKVIK